MSDSGPSAALTGAEWAWLREIGLRLRLGRVRLGLSQSEWGNRSRVSRVTIGSVERADHVAALMTYRRLAVALAVPLDELLSETATKESWSSRLLRLPPDGRQTG